MKFYGNIHHHLKIEKSEAKERYGLISVNCNLCKPNGKDLGTYLVSMIFSTLEFAEDCGIELEEANQAMAYLRERIAHLEFEEIDTK